MAPDFVAARTDTESATQRQRINELATEVRQLGRERQSLRIKLTAERKRHGRLETALSKYTSGLENQLVLQTELVAELKRAVVETLGRNLIHQESK